MTNSKFELQKKKNLLNYYLSNPLNFSESKVINQKVIKRNPSNYILLKKKDIIETIDKVSDTSNKQESVTIKKDENLKELKELFNNLKTKKKT